MSYCINPYCKRRENADDAAYCQGCGTSLNINDRYRINAIVKRNEFVCTEIFEVKDLNPEEGEEKKILKIIYDDDVKISSTEKKFTVLTRLFKREQDFLTEHRNPGIPLGYEKFSFTLSDGKEVHCLVMEKIKGINLEQWIESNGPITQERALRWLKQIVYILDFIHEEKDFFHRDIKPSNIMRRQIDQRLVLIDFGAIKEICLNQNRPQVTTQIGTPGYQSPEQSHGQAEKKSDFYALGRTFVYLLTRKSPHQMEMQGTISQWEEHITHPISPSFIKLINDLMEQGTSKRPENTQNILARLDHIQEEIVNSSSFPLSSDPLSSGSIFSGPIYSGSPPSGSPYSGSPHSGGIPAGATPLKPGPSQNPVNPNHQHRTQSFNPNNLLQSLRNRIRRNKLIKIAAIASGIIGLILLVQLCSNPESAPKVGIPAACNNVVKDRDISCGENILTPQPNDHADKRSGSESINDDDYFLASKLFQDAWKPDSNSTRSPDPEPLIYFNNANIFNKIQKGDISAQEVRTIAVAAPLQNLQKDKNIFNQGLEMLRGVAQAQDEAFKKGTYLVVAIANDANKPDEASNIAKKLGKNEDILGVIGHYSSTLVEAAIKDYKQNKLPLVSPSSTSVGLSGHEYLYRIAPNDAASGEKIVKHLENQSNTQKVAIFWSPGDSFSESLKREIEKGLSSKNINIINNDVDREIFNFKNRNFNPQNALEKAKEQGVTAIVLIPDPGTSRSLERAYSVIEKNDDRNLIIIGADTLYRSKTIENIKDNNLAKNNLRIAVGWHPLDNENFSNSAKEYWDTPDVSWLTATSYDATLVLIEATKDYSNREDVKKYISNPNFTLEGDTATGKIGFKIDRDKAKPGQNFRSDRDHRESTLVKVLPICNNPSSYKFAPESYSQDCLR